MSIQITVAKTDLDKAVRIASIAIASGDDTDVTTHYIFRIISGGSGVEIQTYKEDLCVQVPVKGVEIEGGTEDQTFTVPGKRMAKFLSGLTKGRVVRIEYDEQDRRVTLAVMNNKTMKSRGRTMTGDQTKIHSIRNNFAAARITATSVDPAKIKAALDYSQSHASDDEARKAHLASVVVRNGMFEATDSNALCFVTMASAPELSKTNLLIKRAHVAAILAFLGNDLGSINILEHDIPMPPGSGVPGIYLVSQNDGTLMYVSRWGKEPPPTPKVDKDGKDMCSLTVSIEALDEALGVFPAFADSDDKYVHVRADGEELVLSMASASGASDSDEWRVPIVAQENLDLFADHAGFGVNRVFLEQILPFYKGDGTLKLGLTWMKKGGFVRLRKIKDGDEFVTILVWMKK